MKYTTSYLVAATLSVASLVASAPEKAQINYDAANSSYFVVGGTDNVINTDYGFNNVFVGKDNLTHFNTLPGNIALTIAEGANIYSSPVTAPDNVSYSGVNVFGNHRVNVTGGTVSQARGFDTSIVNISGGIVYNTRSADNSTMNLSGGTVGEFDPIQVLGTSTLNLTGTFAVTTSNERWALDSTTGLGRVQDYAITGTLSDGTNFNRTITASVSGASLAANTIRLRGASLVQENPLFFTSNGVANSFSSFVTVGRNSDGTVNTSPTVTLTEGLNTGVVNIYNNSTTNMTGGTVVGDTNVRDTSLFNQNGGTTNNINTYGTSTTRISGGTVRGVAFAWDRGSTVNVTNGDVNIAWAIDGTVNVSGGTVADTTAEGEGQAFITGGNVRSSYANFNQNGGGVFISNGNVDFLRNTGGRFDISGGTVNSAIGTRDFQNTFNVSGGTVNDLSNFGDNGITNIRGGLVNRAGVYNTSTLDITGGVVGTAHSDEDAIVNFSGGTVNAFTVGGRSTLNLSGSGFSVNAGGERWGWDGNTLGRVRDYTITGALANGTTFNQTITASVQGATTTDTAVQLRGFGLQAASDLFVTTDTTVNDAYSNVIVGFDETFGNATSPTVSVNTGAIVGTIQVYNGGRLTMNDGEVLGVLLGLDNSVVEVNGGNIAAVGGIANSRLAITGGNIGDIFGFDDAQITLSGGTIGRNTIEMFNNSTLNILGTNLSFSLLGTGVNEFDESYTIYSLGGLLLDGQSIDGVNLWDFTGGRELTGPDSFLFFNGTRQVVVAPEPGSIALLLLGGPMLLGLARRRK